MFKYLGYVWVLFFCTRLLAQGAVGFEGKSRELLIGQEVILKGELTNVKISSAAPHLFVFTRKFEKNHYLYICDRSTAKLTEVAAVRYAGASKFRSDTWSYPVYNGQLDWRPVLDAQNRQWFTFVSNGVKDNRDIYIGYLGGDSYLKLTELHGIDEQPKWSPDGNAIAFLSDRNNSHDIYLFENLDKVIAEGNLKLLRLKRLTSDPQEERDLAWNPNPRSHLLAYARRHSFPGRESETFQIRVLDLKGSPKGSPKGTVFEITNDPLYDYTKAIWNIYRNDQLLYLGREIVDPDAQTHLYLTELKWGRGNMLQNKNLEGYKLLVFKNICKADENPARWLPGGEAILAQANKKEFHHPLYSVNIARWRKTQKDAVNLFRDLYQAHPKVSGYDLWENNLIFTVEKDKRFKIYTAALYGNDILPGKSSSYKLTHPSLQGHFYTNKYVLLGGAAILGGATYMVVKSMDSEEPVPIALPPDLP